MATPGWPHLAIDMPVLKGRTGAEFPDRDSGLYARFMQMDKRKRNCYGRQPARWPAARSLRIARSRPRPSVRRTTKRNRREVALAAARSYGRRFECEFKYYPERMEGVFWKWVPAI